MHTRTKNSNWVFTRLIILLFFPILLTTIFSYYSQRASKIDLDIEAVEESKSKNGEDPRFKTSAFSKSIDVSVLTKTEDSLKILLKIPDKVNIFKYNIYIKNNLIISNLSDVKEDLKTELQVDVVDIDYQPNIVEGEERVITSNVDLDRYYDIKRIDYSFRFFKNGEEITDSFIAQFDDNKKYMTLYLKSSIGTNLAVFFLTLIFSQSLVLLFGSFYQFIRFGKPFTKI